MLVSEAWNLYKTDKQIQGYSSQTLKVYKVQIYLLIKYFGDNRITDITTESIKLYLGEVAAELKASSLCHQIRFIKRCLNGLKKRSMFQLTWYLPLKN